MKKPNKASVKFTPSKTVHFEVSVKPDENGKSVFDDSAFPAIENLDAFRAPRDKSIETARKLEKHGISVKHIGDFSISAECSPSKFERFFKTKIVDKKPPRASLAPKGYVMRSPDKNSPWAIPKADGFRDLIDRAYIQHPPLFFADERPLPPFWNDKFRLRVPGDVAQLMRASAVHKRGVTGSTVKVAMTDSGFYHHPFFKEQGYNFLAVTAPDVVDYTSDPSGHGTGESANVFATAPNINFIGVKIGNPALGIKTATELNPDIITNSWGYDLDRPNTSMPNWLKPLHLAVLDAVSKGITVCFSAGNGHYAFPGSMPEVISVGGVVVDADLNYSATDYTSGFDSTWFPGRQTPDVCGLCGTRPRADYIVLPVQRGSDLDSQDGWGAFSGTSAASPMVAGVCALLKEIDPDLTPQDIKNLLKYTARDITQGTNSHGNVAAQGPDRATGYGLVNAERAVDALL
ncbi:MAG: S8 family serine peptidase [Pseudomonadota bacterium]